MASRCPKMITRWARDGLIGPQDGPKKVPRRLLGPSWVFLGPFWCQFRANFFEKQKFTFSHGCFIDFLVPSWLSGGYVAAIIVRPGAMLGH